MARHWSEEGSATVGRLLLAAIARGARTAAVVKELADRRTALSREYQFADGSRKVEVYLEPINYEDSSGIRQHIEEKLSVSKLRALPWRTRRTPSPPTSGEEIPEARSRSREVPLALRSVRSRHSLPQIRPWPLRRSSMGR